MIPNNELIPILREAGEGEIILAGELLSGLSDEKIAWVVQENHKRVDKAHRITLHGYWHDVFIVSKVCVIGAATGSGIEWGKTEVKS